MCCVPVSPPGHHQQVVGGAGTGPPSRPDPAAGDDAAAEQRAAAAAVCRQGQCGGPVGGDPAGRCGLHRRADARLPGGPAEETAGLRQGHHQLQAQH